MTSESDARPRGVDEDQNKYRCMVYGHKTVEVVAESSEEAESLATQKTDTGELSGWVDGQPEMIDEVDDAE